MSAWNIFLVIDGAGGGGVQLTVEVPPWAGGPGFCGKAG